MRRRTRYLVTSVAALAVLGVLGAGQLSESVSDQSPISPSVSASSVPSSPPSELMVQLSSLPTGPVAPTETYQRAAFGQRWADVDRTGCDQRNEALAQAMTEISYRAGTRDCVVEAGTFHDVYDGTSWLFVKSQDGGGVEIDHIVPLAHAWEMGAASWTEGQRELFANELVNLQATAGTYNSSKGTKSPHEWMPADVAYQCTYVQRWSEIKVTWGLALEELERDYLLKELDRCSE